MNPKQISGSLVYPLIKKIAMIRPESSLILFSLLFFACERNQKDQVPERIRQNFNETYTNAEKVKWSLKKNSYEVDFYLENKHIEAEYDLEGNQIQEESMIEKVELPQPIKDYLNKHYPQYHVGEASIEIKGEKKVYELELLNGFFREIELEFDMNGNLLSKETFN